MQSNGTFRDELRRQYQHGGMHIKLIYVNVAVFLVITIFNFIAKVGDSSFLGSLTEKIFTLEREPAEFIYRPWGLFTYLFAHFDFFHLLFNMLFLFVFGQYFLAFFSGRRLLITYIAGGIFGGLIEMLFALVPAFSGSGTVAGASAACMAVIAAVAFYRPMMEVSLFGVIRFPIFILGLVYIVSDFIGLGSNDHVAHAAHLGGALLGILSVTNVHSSGNIINRIETVVQRSAGNFSSIYKPGTRLKVEKGGRTRKTDEQYNAEAKSRQEKIDKILDKISRSGYESLTKAEKDFLFSQSKK